LVYQNSEAMETYRGLKPKTLSHIMNRDGRSTLCGRGLWMATAPVIKFPSVTSLPGCRGCREKFLESIGVKYDNYGYPVL